MHVVDRNYILNVIRKPGFYLVLNIIFYHDITHQVPISNSELLPRGTRLTRCIVLICSFMCMNHKKFSSPFMLVCVVEWMG